MNGHNWMNCLSLLLSFAGVFILALYTLVTALQAWFTRKALAETRRSNKATEESNEIARQSLILGRRAWLIPKIDAEPLSKSGRFTVSLANFGGAPAIVKRIGMNGIPVQLMPSDFELLPKEIYKPGNAIVPPGTNDLVVSMEIPECQTGPDRDLLVVYCRIEYTDVFDVPRETRLCWFRLHGRRQWWNVTQFSKMT